MLQEVLSVAIAGGGEDPVGKNSLWSYREQNPAWTQREGTGGLSRGSSCVAKTPGTHGALRTASGECREPFGCTTKSEPEPGS